MLIKGNKDSCIFVNPSPYANPKNKKLKLKGTYILCYTISQCTGNIVLTNDLAAEMIASCVSLIWASTPLFFSTEKRHSRKNLSNFEDI